MGSLDLQLWMRVGTMNRRGTRASAAASWSAAVLCRFRMHEAIQSARGLAHSKTWRWSGRFMGRGGSVRDLVRAGIAAMLGLVLTGLAPTAFAQAAMPS